MTDFDDFYAQYNGKYVEVEDSGALNQCMDLAFAWCDKLKIDRAAIRHGYAFQIWDQPTDQLALNFDMLPNAPSALPGTGDIIIWRSAYNGGAGHVGICTGRVDMNSMDVFEQNDPLKSPAHTKTYGYSNVYGWLRKKTPPPDTSALQAQINALQTKITNAKSALA